MRERSTTGSLRALWLPLSLTASSRQTTTALGSQAIIMIKTVILFIYLRANSLYLSSHSPLSDADRKAVRGAATLPSRRPRIHQARPSTDTYLRRWCGAQCFAHVAKRKLLNRGVFQPETPHGRFPFLRTLFNVRGHGGLGRSAAAFAPLPKATKIVFAPSLVLCLPLQAHNGTRGGGAGPRTAMGEGGKRLSRAHRELVLRFRRKMAGPRDAFGHPAYNQGVVYSTLAQFGCEQGP